ncbi:MAG: lytic transglycosylase domain-containing protein [Paracoccaceae bacterium]
MVVAIGVALAAPATAAPDDGTRAIGPTDAAPRLVAAPPERPARRFAEMTKARPICALIEAAAETHGLPKDFFARLIWRESRFDVRALSPVGAQGIAQFMPATAKLVGLAAPWDPVQAIPASAAHLADLREELGNWGLAAAGYNAGSGRVWSWLAGRSGLPYETLAYVQGITGEPAETFRERDREPKARPLAEGARFLDACSALPVMKTRASPVVRKLWGVQVAGNIDRGRAVRQFSRLKRRFGPVWGGQAHQVVAVRGPRGRRPLWSVQIGFDSRRPADRLCARLKLVGAACLVRKN